jgi:exopolysaccharide biosynthesis polyprenyl glycosylphosphotransferase
MQMHEPTGNYPTLAQATTIPGPSPQVSSAPPPVSLAESHRRGGPFLHRHPSPALARAVLDTGMLTVAALPTAITGWQSPSLTWALAFPALVLLLLKARGLYTPRVTKRLLDELRSVVGLTAVGEMVIISFRALLQNDPHLNSQSIVQWLFAAVTLSAGRIALTLGERHVWSKGEGLSPALIIGAGRVGRLVAKRLLDHPECGLRPIGFLDKDPMDEEVHDPRSLAVLGASWDLERVIAEHGVRHVIVSFSTAPHHVILRIVNRCEELGVTVSLVPRLFEKMTDRLRIEHLGGLPIVTVERADPKGWQFGLKYAADRILAAVGLIIVSPILILASLAVRLTMGSPVFFRQLRVGLDGRTFEIIKFRSMQPEGEAEPSTSRDSDTQRLTRLGAFLRRTSLDELPQLFNVLRGEMSLIGPRPERPELAEIFEQHVHRYGDRHRVKSGITGWAQVHGIGRGDNRFSETTLGDRVEWDNYYIENWSFWLDVKIVLMTVAAILRFHQP